MFFSGHLDKIFGFILPEYLMWRLCTGQRVLSWRYVLFECLVIESTLKLAVLRGSFWSSFLMWKLVYKNCSVEGITTVSYLLLCDFYCYQTLPPASGIHVLTPPFHWLIFQVNLKGMKTVQVAWLTLASVPNLNVLVATSKGMCGLFVE